MKKLYVATIVFAAHPRHSHGFLKDLVRENLAEALELKQVEVIEMQGVCSDD